MMIEKAYRLGEYRITVYDDVLVRWERHAPLGNARIGKCYLYGDVLIIGSQSRKEDGYLIGEFHDALRKLPLWNGTRFYCFAGELFDASTGQALNDEELERYSYFHGGNRSAPGCAAAPDPGSYRLVKYHITATADGRISWHAYGDLNRITSGPCSIQSGILVIGPQEHDEPGKGRQVFLDALRSLQSWDATRVWCRGSVLQLCTGLEQREHVGLIIRLRDRWQNRTAYPAPGSSPAKHPDTTSRPVPTPAPIPARISSNREISKKFLLAGLHAVKNKWQGLRAGKAWLKRFFVLITAVLLVFLIAAALYFAEKGLPWSHDFKKHHHKHHDHEH